ncbi:MAG: Sua5/YciO/YrdC/YwlC family protein, partial [Deltaproteobacteria bacterium]|nr:Sua5/YciO/YrdC/YwlC family protein [Deltaproteobacteria bacterium]
MAKNRASSVSKKPLVISINPDNPQQRLINSVTEVLEGGGLIAYPTDTFYGIGCDLYNK